MTRPRLPVLLAAALALVLAACGGSETAGSESAATPTPTPTATPETAISKDTSTKPEIPKPTGEPPTKLVKRDVVVGKGRAAKPGDQVTVQYVGVSFSTGQQFDASWDSGQPFPFNLGAGEVIPGWDRGVKGMKVGGRRELVIPPELG